MGELRGTELQRREAFDRRRSEQGRRMRFYSLEPREGEAAERLVNADGVLWMALSDRYDFNVRPLMSEVAADLGVNDELTRLILLGKRKPSKAFLDAIGYERVTLYRRKQPATGRAILTQKGE